MKRTITALWEPVTLDEAKEQIQGLEGINDFDAYITRLISAARERAEQYCWRTITGSTYELRLNSFTSEKILLPYPVVSAITSVKYKDTTGTEITIPNTDYQLMDWEEPAILMPAYGKTWPTARGFDGDITITYVGGYASADEVPAVIKQAILMMVRTWFDQRDDVTPRSVNEMPRGSEYMLKPYRCFRF